MTYWLTDWLINWLTKWVNDWMPDYLTAFLSERLWLYGWLTGYSAFFLTSCRSLSPNLPFPFLPSPSVPYTLSVPPPSPSLSLPLSRHSISCYSFLAGWMAGCSSFSPRLKLLDKSKVKLCFVFFRIFSRSVLGKGNIVWVVHFVLFFFHELLLTLLCWIKMLWRVFRIRLFWFNRIVLCFVFPFPSKMRCFSSFSFFYSRSSRKVD